MPSPSECPRKFHCDEVGIGSTITGKRGGRCGSYHLVGPPVAIVANDRLLVLNRKVEGNVRRLLVDKAVGPVSRCGCHFDTEREDRDGLLVLGRGLYTYLQTGAPLLTRREGGLGLPRAHWAETRLTFRHVPRLAGREQKVFI